MKIRSWFCLLFLLPGIQAQATEFNEKEFSKADSVAFLYAGHSLVDTKKLVDKLTQSQATEEGKFRAIFRWVCENIEYDYSLYQLHERSRRKITDPKQLEAWNRKFSSLVFKKLRTNHKTVCTGYAYLIKELATQAGITCSIVDGYGRNAHSNIRGSGIPNHSWNAVKLHNKWYLCDATWSSGFFDAKTGGFVKAFRDVYFLTEPSLFARNHHPLDPAWSLLDTTPNLQEFLNGPIIYASTFAYPIRNPFPENLDVTVARDEPVLFQFEVPHGAPIKTAELYSKESTVIHASFLKREEAGEDVYHLSYRFSAKGTHVVHILLNSAYVFTYSVKVK